MGDRKIPPIVIALFGLMIGIISAYHQIFYYSSFTIFGLVLSFIGYVLWGVFYRKKTHLSTLSGILFYIFLGFFLFNFHKKQPSFSNILIKAYTVKVEEVLKTKDKASKLIATIIKSNPHDEFIINKKVILYPPKVDSTFYKRNMNLIIRGQPKKIRPPLNPYVFNYKEYCHNKGIFYQHFINQGEISYFNKNTDISYLDKIQHYVIQTIDRCIENKKASSIIKALSIGYKSELTSETKANFQYSGTIHLLAISGLHVGIFYQTILLFFLPFRKRKTASRWIESILIIMCIWAYGFITGYPTSVQRACLMFSFIVIGNQFRRSTTIYHSLSISAIIILIIQPMQLFDVGFQLSYLAILSIVLVVPQLQKLCKTRYKIPNFLLNILFVSLAAQIGVFPIVLYYFHEFPTYFLLANLIAIPITSILVWGSLLLILTGPFTYLSQLIGSFLEKLTLLFQSFLHFIIRLPYSVLEPTHLALLEVFFLYGFLLFVYLFLMNKKPVFYKIGCSCIILFSLSLTIRKIQFNSGNHFIAYTVSRKTVFQLIDDRSELLYSKPSITLNEQKYLVEPFSKRFSGKKKNDKIVSKNLGEHQLFIWKGYSFLYLDAKQTIPNINCEIDYILTNYITDNHRNELLKKLNYGTLLVMNTKADNALSLKNSYSINKNGAFLKRLPQRF